MSFHKHGSKLVSQVSIGPDSWVSLLQEEKEIGSTKETCKKFDSVRLRGCVVCERVRESEREL